MGTTTGPVAQRVGVSLDVKAGIGRHVRTDPGEGVVLVCGGETSTKNGCQIEQVNEVGNGIAELLSGQLRHPQSLVRTAPLVTEMLR